MHCKSKITPNYWDHIHIRPTGMIWVDWGIEASFWQRLGISPLGFSQLSTRGAKSFSQGNYAIGGVWHWFHPFRYRELLYNQFLSFLTFCCFLWVKNSIYHLGASQNIWLSEFHKFSKKCCCKRSVRKNRFGCTKYSRGVWAISKYSFLR